MLVKNIIWKSGVFLAMVMGLLISFVSPASAAHSNPQLQRGTVVVQTMKGYAAATQAVTDNTSYYDNIPGNPLDVIQGSCFNGMPCFRIYFDHYGNTTWDGLTTHAAICGDSYCNYDGTNSTVTFLQFNLDKMGGYSYYSYRAVVCHEFGHGVSLEHTAGSTCMQATGTQYFKLSTGTDGQELELYKTYAYIAK